MSSLRLLLLSVLVSIVFAIPAKADPCPPGINSGICTAFPSYTNSAPGVTTPAPTDRIPYVQGPTTHYLPPPQGANVSQWGAYGDGIHDDTAAIQAAINSCVNPILFDANKIYKFSSALMIGNGSGTAVNTACHPVLKGPDMAGVAINYQNDTPPGPFVPTQPVLRWAGASNAVVGLVQINGLLQGWGLQNLTIQCSNPGNNLEIGLLVYGGQYGDNRNLQVLDCQAGINEYSWSTIAPGLTDQSDLYNSFYRTFIRIDGSPTIYEYGVFMGSADPSGGDVDFNDFRTLMVEMDCPNTSIYCAGVYMRDADTNYISNYHPYNYGTPNSHVLVMDYSDNGGAWPSMNTITHGDFDARTFLNVGTPFNASTWLGGPAFNYIDNQGLGNGAGQPLNIPGLIVDHAAGSWTPALVGSITPGVPIYAVPPIGVVKVNGWDVEVDFTIVISDMGGATGFIEITGLPVNQNANVPTGFGNSTFGNCTFGQWGGVNLDTGYTQLNGVVQGGTTPIVALGEAGITGQQVTAITVPRFTSSYPVQLTGTCHYTR